LFFSPIDVKFLVDNQLPGLLCQFLRRSGHDCSHVLDLSMDEKSDGEIWVFAKSQSYIVISKDDDFVHLANRFGDTGRLLWVRIGNCRKQHLIARFEQNIHDVVLAFDQGSRIVEIR
jgi:predicted nuclease of predicted toxin-antitoxin system